MRIKKLDLNLLEQEKSRELRAKRRVLSKTFEGSWSALLKGRGMEFAGFRQYTSSDDASRIDWGASLRANDTLVREFEEFKNVNILFLLDVSDTMLSSSQKKLKAEYAAELMFQLSIALMNNGDSVGFALFTDHIVTQELPSVGRLMVNRMAASLSKPENYGGKKNFGNVITAVNAQLKERVLVIIVSDFIGFEAGWDRYVRMLGQKYDLIGIMLRDPRDRNFPEGKGQIVLQDTLTGEKMFVDIDDARESYGKYVEEEEAYIKRVFDTAKAGLVSVSTDDEDPLKTFQIYLRKRASVVRG